MKRSLWCLSTPLGYDLWIGRLINIYNFDIKIDIFTKLFQKQKYQHIQDHLFNNKLNNVS